MDYVISLSQHDHKPHIYESRLFGYHNPVEMVYDQIWDGLVIRADLRAIEPFTHNVGDEFEAVGKRWVIIEYDPMSLIMTCTTANAEGYRLLLFQLIFQTELRLMHLDAWYGMSKYMQHECWDDWMNNRVA